MFATHARMKCVVHNELLAVEEFTAGNLVRSLPFDWFFLLLWDRKSVKNLSK